MSNSSQSTHPTERVLWEELLVLNLEFFVPVNKPVSDAPVLLLNKLSINDSPISPEWSPSF